MKAHLRYAACVLVAFAAAAYAVNTLLAAYFSLGIRVVLESYGGGGVISRPFNEYSFQWRLLSVALYLWVCVIAWRFRKTP